MRQIANYIVDDEPVARGGMGQIFRGQDSKGNVVAIKEILPEFATDWSIRSRIEKEVEFLMKCDHPSIVKLHLAFFDAQTQNYYIVMEMVDGLTIEQYVMRNGPFSEQEAVTILLKILDALQCVHNSRIIHRDIKPSNIMLRPNGNICLLDFGVAKDMVNGGGTQAGTQIGTDGYMSPEQAEGFSINYNSDIYSLGCVFFYMLTGHHAFNTLGSDFETKDAIIKTEFPRLSKYNKNVSEVVQRILDKATDKNMLQRYQNCYEFMAALSNGTHISHTSSGATPIMITIGREKCDVIVNDAGHKVSRHHANVELKAMTGRKCYIFTDCSSNGTVVNGRVVRNSSVNIPFDGPAPEIYLAGVVDGLVNWDDVKNELQKRVRAIQNVEDAEVTSAQKIEKVPDSDVKKSSSSRSPLDEEYEHEGESAIGWLVAIYALALLGSIFSIIIAVYIFQKKVKLPGERSDYMYKKSHRIIGLSSILLNIISNIVIFCLIFG